MESPARRSRTRRTLRRTWLRVVRAPDDIGGVFAELAAQLS